MKKLFIALCIIFLTMSGFAQELVMLPVTGNNSLETLFQRPDLTIHFYNDDFVIASAFETTDEMTVLDEKAFSDTERYFLVYCPKDLQQQYINDEVKSHGGFSKSINDDMIIVKVDKAFHPAKNDGMVAISNHKARLPKKTRSFPEVTVENPDVRFLLDQVSQDSMEAVVQHMQDYGSRKWDGSNVQDCAQWIKGKFESLGLEVTEQPVTYYGSPTSPNIIAIQRGKLYPDTYVVCGAHHDSYNWSGACPGADDNATGTASVLESARIMSQFDFDYSIMYCSYACEEMGLIGSDVHASSCAENDLDIIGYFNNDMNGYLYGNDIHIHQIYPSSAEPCGAFYRNVGQVYFPEMVIEKKNFTSGDSDHTSFNNCGYQGIYPFEDIDHYSPYIHTANDLIGLSVNSWDMAQRYCQMNIACLAEVAGMHQRGPIILKDFAITEDDNSNGKMNPGEDVTISLTMENVFDYAVHNVTVNLTCDNEYIEILNDELYFGDFNAGEELTMNGLKLHLSANAPAACNYVLKVTATGNEATCSSQLRIMAYDYILVEDNIRIMSGSGLLEPGETADIRIYAKNKGNEPALGLEGFLESTSEYVTINTNDQNFGTIIPSANGYADFNISLSGDAPEDFVLPFTLTLTDSDGRTTTLEYLYRNACNVVFNLADSYGDGWNNAYIEVKFNDGTPSESLTCSGSSETHILEIMNSTNVSLVWHSGSWDYECSFEVTYEDGSPIYSSTGSESGTFFTWINNCSNGSNLCGGVNNLNVSETLLVTWEAPSIGTATSYDVYRETDFLANVTELSYQDESDLPAGTITYCVYPHFEDCEGETICASVNYNPIGVDENDTAQTKIYPNPAKDILTFVSNTESKVMIYNIHGQEVARLEVIGTANVDVSGMPSGIYVVKIINDGISMRKVVIE